IEYIDYQSFLNFYGNLNSPSKQGNDIQKVIRVLIAAVLLKKQEQALHKVPTTNLYTKFTEILTENDTVITLNYDTLLEYFFKSKRKKFRLLPPWIYDKKMNFEPYSGVTLLKVHGSINWFDL
ncbi:TPA: SIR2 family protein, partial [Legionella pneumophila]|nr:SIR2 family protein [Legionella pneumophila]